MEMESPKLGFDSDDLKYVSGLSTVLVAAIEEAKDRISQIEYIFCTQLYPKFKSQSKSIHRESHLLLQLETLKQENLQLHDRIHSLKKERDETVNDLTAKQKSQQDRIAELESDVRRKSEEVDEGMRLQNKLLQLVQSNASVIATKGKEIKDHEEERSALVAKRRGLEEMIERLREEIDEKSKEIDEVRALNGNVMKKIDWLSLEVSEKEGQLLDCGREKAELLVRLKSLAEKVGGLERELLRKTKEAQEASELNVELLEQIDRLKSEKHGDGEERSVLLCKVKELEDEVKYLQACRAQSNGNESERSRLEQELRREIELKSLELVSERKRKEDTLLAYKRVKSQLLYLCKKYGLTNENMIPQSRLVARDDLSSRQDITASKACLGKNNESPTLANCRTTVKEEICEEGSLKGARGDGSPENVSSSSPSSKGIVSPKRTSPLAGTKRPASCWRETRSHHSRSGPDPHDDFLDTPFENIRGNLVKVGKEICASPKPKVDHGERDGDFSEDETQDVGLNVSPRKQQMPPASDGKKGFKYVEPVRKKADRENLKGIECRQCKKFYDAILPDNESRNADNRKADLRCEHHEGVSRHRYKYAPPLTPEGFWNIGFESEM